ncbi:TetR/AcrR family transcriptional regulator [Nocardia sp. NPDC127606]|uniref:TetR/AcrR family transcriptional regulator n=1 Tax=Nocardia sp. NPDC127606 TaxID=3345406 RepID=UPI00362BEC56
MRRVDVVRDYGGISAEQRRADRRGKLVAAGRRIWGQSGVGEVTVRGVSSAAGVIPRYFYEHFTDRDALLNAVLDEVSSELIAATVEASTNTDGDWPGKLQAAIRALLDLVADDPHLYRIVTSDTPMSAARRNELAAAITEIMIQLGPDYLAPDQLDPVQLRRRATFIVGGVDRLIETWLSDRNESTTDLAEACTHLAIAVMGAPLGRGQ